MSAPQSSGRNKALVAAAVGAGVIIGAAGVYLLNILQQKSTRDSRSLKVSRSISSASRRSKKPSLSSSRSGHETEDEMFSALNSDDEEYYDINSEDEEILMGTLEDSKIKISDSKLFEEVDILMKGDDKDRLNAFNLLKTHEFDMSEDPDFLWRYAKAYQMQAVVYGAQKDMEAKKKFIYQGLGYASKALALDETNPDVNKWFAILTGMQGEFVSIKQKIQNGYLFYKHVHIAIKSKPQDYSLHHLLGRFKFEVANTSWVERKVASSLFAEIPEQTYSDAITDLLTAESLNPTPWKENRLLLARCYIGDGKYEEAIRWLDSAKEIPAKTKEDTACDQEINNLMEKYKKYRK